MNLEKTVPRVVGSGKGQGNLNFPDSCVKRFRFGSDLLRQGVIAIGFSDLYERQKIRRLLFHLSDRQNKVSKTLGFLHQLLGLLRIIPKTGRICLPLNIGDSLFF
jgi:hypothetical protein